MEEIPRFWQPVRQRSRPERIMVDAFTRRRVDGLILSTITEDQGYLHVEREQGTPLVFVDRPPSGLLADAIITNNYEATARPRDI